MDLIKCWFIDEENKRGWGFLIVDGYNCMVGLDFYEKNELLFLFWREEEEGENVGYEMRKWLDRGVMYYDLKKLS